MAKNKIEKWKVFEKECAEYLQRKYFDTGHTFIVNGGSDSTMSDIQVIKDEKPIFTIECKMSVAQSGQFVLFVNEEDQKFIFSNRNKTPYDDFVKAIIGEMELNFEKCIVSSKNLPISEKVICEWVKNYYLEVKKSSYCITKGKLGYLLFPIESIDKYFSFSAKYRLKRSGSSNPSKNNCEEIESLLKKIDKEPLVEFDDTGCFATIQCEKDIFILKGEKYRYQLSREDSRFRIRRLSNTCNANFIVTIKLKQQTQDEYDLLKFEAELIVK